MSSSRARAAESVFRLTFNTASLRPQHHVCRACLHAAATRAFHDSPSRLADKPWHQRLTESIFGSKESRKTDQARTEKQEQKIIEVKAGEGAAAVPVKIDGRQYEIAPFVDPATDPGYVRSKTWHGLERLGGERWIERQADKHEAYEGFAPSNARELTEGQWDALLHLTAIEAFTLRRAGRDINQLSHSRTRLPINFVIDGEVALQPESKENIVFLNSMAEKEILDNIPETDGSVNRISLMKLLQALKHSVDSGKWKVAGDQSTWTGILLRDPAVRLAIHKRLFQLTGKRLPDVVLMQVNNLEQLRREYIRKPLPKKVVHDQRVLRVGHDTPNVKVFPKRRTIQHKEQEIGRWKLIEEELHRRGLPVSGTNFPSGKAYVPGL